MASVLNLVLQYILFQGANSVKSWKMHIICIYCAPIRAPLRCEWMHSSYFIITIKCIMMRAAQRGIWRFIAAGVQQ